MALWQRPHTASHSPDMLRKRSRFSSKLPVDAFVVPLQVPCSSKVLPNTSFGLEVLGSDISAVLPAFNS